MSKVTKDAVTPSLKRLKKELAALPREVYNYWVSVTPIDTGNARRKTKLVGDTIHANYAYADRLDEGYSKQAPNGMTEPTNKFIEKRIRQMLRK